MPGQAGDRAREGREAETGDQAPDLGAQRRMPRADAGEPAWRRRHLVDRIRHWPASQVLLAIPPYVSAAAADDEAADRHLSGRSQKDRKRAASCPRTWAGSRLRQMRPAGWIQQTRQGVGGRCA